MFTGRLTLPIECGMDDQLSDLIKRLGADAVRNSDGTELPDIAQQLVERVYATYFPARGDQDWAESHPEQTTQIFLMSDRVTAMTTTPLWIDVLAGYLTDQFSAEIDCDTAKMWQVIDRTTGRTLSTGEYQITTDAKHPGKPGRVGVKIAEPELYHVYTVGFLARQLWDSTQMYNYITNNWAADPTRVKETPYDIRYPETWQYVRTALADWLVKNPQINVVRFTTFFYHFTLAFNDQEKEKYVDWFGYSALSF